MTIKQITSGTDDDKHAKSLEDTGYWGAQAAGCLVFCDSTKRFLIAQRSAYVQEPFTWGTIGGAIDAKERAIDGVRREFKEETGYRGTFTLVPMYVFKDKAFSYYNFLAIVKEEFDAKLDWETSKFVWVEYGEWPNPMHFGLKALLKDPKSAQIMKRAAGLSEASVEIAGLTVPGVNKELKKRGIRETLVKGKGYYYFTDGDSINWYDASIPVYSISDLTIEDIIRHHTELKSDYRNR